MKPILFNTEMVRAILEGRKTVTRRVVKAKSKYALGFKAYNNIVFDVLDVDFNGDFTESKTQEPPYKVGDVLYVRETWCKWYCYECANCIGDGTCDCGNVLYDPEINRYFCYRYRASADEDDIETWKPSIHMPKAAARIFLRVTSVRVERLRDITDPEAEGIKVYPTLNDPEENYYKKLIAFSELWDSTIKKDQLKHYGWQANPYVWVIEFERVEGKCSD